MIISFSIFRRRFHDKTIVFKNNESVNIVICVPLKSNILNLQFKFCSWGGENIFEPLTLNLFLYKPLSISEHLLFVQ